MNSRIALFGIVGFIVVLLVGYLAFMRDDGGEDEVAAREVYTNERYGYSFEIPEGMSYLAYADESVSVGTTTEGGIESAVDIRIYSSGEEVGYGSYEAFVVDVLRNACAADGPNETISCEAVAERTPFTTSRGVSGEIVSLTRVYENLETGERTLGSFGPHYVFDISEQEPLEYVILAVSAPAHLPLEAVDYRALHVVADSMQFENMPAPAATTTATGTPAETE